MLKEEAFPERLYSLDDLEAAGAGCKKTLRRMIDKGELPVVNISPRVVRVRERDWITFLDARKRTVGRVAA